VLQWVFPSSCCRSIDYGNWNLQTDELGHVLDTRTMVMKMSLYDCNCRGVLWLLGGWDGRKDQKGKKLFLEVGTRITRKRTQIEVRYGV
jgi:hypothetical protein